MQVWHVIKALFDKRTPLVPKVIGGLVLAYIIIPFDLIPDAPVVGWFDDATLTALGLFIISKLIPKEVLEEYLRVKP
jgi:carbonic anhydrase